MPDLNPVLLLCHLTGLAVFLVWWSAIAFASSDEAFRLLIGILIATVGTVVRRRAVVSLGDAFISDVRPRPEVVKLKTSGVYARVRHPSELGLLLASLGAGFATGAAPSLAVSLAVLLPLSYMRVRIEERNLRDEFGKTYVDYEKRTGRFLPRLWREMGAS